MEVGYLEPPQTVILHNFMLFTPKTFSSKSKEASIL